MERLASTRYMAAVGFLLAMLRNWDYRARSAVVKLKTTRDGAYSRHLGFTTQVTEVFLLYLPINVDTNDMAW